MRITPDQQEIMVVLDKWAVDHHPTFSRYDHFHERTITAEFDVKATQYWALVDSLVKFVKEKDDLRAKEFHKAVELAYQRGLNRGSGAEGAIH